MPQGRPVDLASCADEPIHVPGSIQPHGALLFAGLDGLIEGWSANLPAMLGLQPVLGMPAAALALPPAAAELLAGCLASQVDGEAPPSVAAIGIGGADYDCIVHATRGRVIAEFEQRAVPADQVALFAVKAHGAIEALRRQKSVDGLLDIAVRQVREITGFDRVMAYRFRQDDSGDVVAEARRGDLPPYLGQRYPAGDIPAQARRLYLLNTLRMIADTGYRPVPVLGAEGREPLDMSFAVLRSVSPVHIEYLQNMGVAASMSVSIVINGRLWGLLACHHMAPRRVPYALRMAADVLVQVIASTIQSIESHQQGQLAEQAAAVRSRLVESLLLDDDPLDSLARHAGALVQSSHANALLCTHYGKLLVEGGVDGAAVAAIVESLPEGGDKVLARDRIEDWPEALRARLGKWVGMLALPFDPPGGGWCVLLRCEQVEEVAWGGRPEKQEQVGPLGARLTPRGSFDAWHETVRGHARPWEDVVLANARLTLAELLRASSARRAEMEATRAQLLAMLGHDLRDPLHSINMAGMVLEKRDGEPTLARRIRSSSNRMQRLISQVLDMSRIDGGFGLGVALERLDLAALAEDVVDEARMAYPGVGYQLAGAGPLWVDADAARLAQVLSNLLSNARHHGVAGQPVGVALAADGAEALLEVSNAGAEIAPEIVATLFNPFKRGSLNNPRNRSGMGLGLYIAMQIVREHHGTLGYRHQDGRVIFALRLPLAAPAPGA